MLNADMFSNVFNGHCFIYEKPKYFFDLIVGKNCVLKVGPLWHLSRMTTLVIEGRFGRAISLDGIRRIFFMGSPSEVSRIAANWVVAGMKRVFAFFRRAMLQESRDPRSNNILPGPYLKDSVPTRAFSFRYPWPTLIWSILLNLGPKSCNIFVGKVDHDPLYRIIGGWSNR